MADEKPAATKKRQHVAVDPDLHATLKNIAQTEGKSLIALVGECLTGFVENYDPEMLTAMQEISDKRSELEQQIADLEEQMKDRIRQARGESGDEAEQPDAAGEDEAPAEGAESGGDEAEDLFA